MQDTERRGAYEGAKRTPFLGSMYPYDFLWSILFKVGKDFSEKY
jgi:hypothetical protein